MRIEKDLRISGKGGRGKKVNLRYSGIMSLMRKHREPSNHIPLTGIHITGTKFGWDSVPV